MFPAPAALRDGLALRGLEERATVGAAMIRVLAFSLAAAVWPVASASTAVDEILAAFQARMTQGGDFGGLFEQVEELSLEEQRKLIGDIDRQWPRLRDGYLSALARAGTAGAGRKSTPQEVAKHRAEFMKVYAMGENAMKDQLSSVSWPALEALRGLLIPTPEQLVAAGGETLREQRKMVRALAEFRDGVLKAAIATQSIDSVSSLEQGEKAAAEAACGFARRDLKVLEDNRKLAAKRSVPEAEVRGIEQCNEWRLLVGLNALVLDPLLCDAARDHSKDMAERGFFAHESPVAGKKSFTDRAANFRTSASAENIFMGSSDPAAANRGWFFSPGHHKNMFSPGHRRIGLGCHGGHWTQMFGG
ncbi:MAG: CAP domain-containing protein [Akkermansiaceae bacterium]|nr:CAP domain-containing protein [Akkermansiaceae bacterium]